MWLTQLTMDSQHLQLEEIKTLVVTAKGEDSVRRLLKVQGVKAPHCGESANAGADLVKGGPLAYTSGICLWRQLLCGLVFVSFASLVFMDAVLPCSTQP